MSEQQKQHELPSIIYIAFEDGMHLGVHTSPSAAHSITESREKHFNALGKFHSYQIATFVRMPSPADRPRAEPAPIEERVRAALLALGPLTQVELVKRILESEEHVDEMQHTFDIQWRAGQRARAMWQEQTGHHSVWPDTANLIVYLMSKIEKVRELCTAAANAESDRANAQAVADIFDTLQEKAVVSANREHQGRAEVRARHGDGAARQQGDGESDPE